MTGTSWAELAQGWSDVEVSTQQNKRGYFLIHSERCERSQDSFLRFWAGVSVAGALLLKITAKKASMNRKFLFIVHRRTGTFILSGKASFACTGRTSMLLDTVCSVHFYGWMFHSVPAIRKKNISNHICPYTWTIFCVTAKPAPRYAEIIFIRGKQKIGKH